MTIEGTPTLAVDLTDDFWYYTTDPAVTGVSVATATGSWVAATHAPDPNGVLGWTVQLSGPEAPTLAGAIRLGYGPNPLRIQLSTGQTVDGGSVYAGTVGVWAPIADPAVYSQVVTGFADPLATVPHPIPPLVDLAVRVASSTLGALVGNQTHPAGAAIEEFRGTYPIHRVSFTHKPVTHIDAITRVDWAQNETPVTTDEYRQRGQTLLFKPVMRSFGGILCGGGIGNLFDSAPPYGTSYGSRYGGGGIGASPYTGGVGTETLVIAYRFGSTVSAAARAAMLHYAHQLYLSYIASDACALPQRTTSVSREGITFQVDTSETYLSEGRVGLPLTDAWIASANPSAGVGRYASARANRPSGVWTSDSPPGVVTSYQLTV